MRKTNALFLGKIKKGSISKSSKGRGGSEHFFPNSPKPYRFYRCNAKTNITMGEIFINFKKYAIFCKRFF
jgi:hypothetical protein